MATSTIVKNTGSMPQRAVYQKRSTAVLADGSAVLCVVDENLAGGAGDGTGVAKIYIYHSTTRSSWTLKNTITPSAAIYNTTYPPVVAFCADQSDNLHIAYVRKTDEAINYHKLTVAAGPTWTDGGAVAVKAAPGVTTYHRAIDIDVHPTLLVPIIMTQCVNVNIMTIQHHMRRTSDSTFQQVSTVDVFTGAQLYHADISIAWNQTPSNGPSSRTYYSTYYTHPSGGSDGGDTVMVYSVNTASAGAGGSTLQNTLSANLNTNLGARMRRSILFSTGANEWSLIGQIGLANASVYAMRYEIVPGGSTVNIKGAYTKSTHYTAFVDYSTTLLMWSAIAYSDDKFMVVGGGGSPLYYTTNGKFTRNGDGTSTITFSPQNYAFDDFFQSASTRFPTAAYAGNNAHIDDSFAKLDFLIADGPQGTTVAAANPHTLRHQYNYGNVAPKNVTPSAGASVNTNVPTLSALLDMDVNNPQGRVKVRWVLATNSGFTLNVRTIDEPDSAYRLISNTSSGVATTTATAVVPTASALFTSTWYVKAAYVSESGQVGTFSAGTSFSVGHPPSAVGLSPSGDEFLKYVDVAGNTVVNFAWKFSDPSPTDSQSSYQIVVENATTGASVVNTGKIASTVNNANVNIPSSAKDIALRWRVTVWDVDDAPATFPSQYQTFFVGDPPTVVTNAPAEASTINTAAPTITYTPTIPGFRTIQSFRIVVTQDLATDVVAHDSGWLPVAVGGPYSYTLPTAVLLNTSDYYVDVYIRDSKNLEGTDRNTFHTSWTAPAAPSFTATNVFYDSLGYVKVTWTNASVDVDWLSWRLYRRTYNATGPTYGPWILLIQDEVDQANYEYHDWLAGSDQGYQYAVVQVADRFGSAIESAYTPSIVTPSTDKYWMIHPLDESFNLPVYVNAESFKEEYEEETYHILGRGRHVDYGDRLGYSGSLTLHLRDRTGYTARLQRQDLEELKREQTPVYLRNPFGDIWLVNLTEIGTERISGVGKHEAANVTVGYEEVAP